MKDQHRAKFRGDDATLAFLVASSDRDTGRLAIRYAEAMEHAGDLDTAAFYRERYGRYIDVARTWVPETGGMPGSPPYPLPTGSVIVELNRPTAGAKASPLQ
jgi:hypothetical protein